jgi:hypothetical protein
MTQIGEDSPVAGIHHEQEFFDGKTPSGEASHGSHGVAHPEEERERRKLGYGKIALRLQKSSEVRSAFWADTEDKVTGTKGPEGKRSRIELPNKNNVRERNPDDNVREEK